VDIVTVPDSPGVPPALPCIGDQAFTAQPVALIVPHSGRVFGQHELGVHSVKHGTPAKLKRVARHKSFDVLGEYLERGDFFESHPLSDVL
jgi:hypothetical protein